ncbi:F-box/kelch-repeat protein At3g06240-like [Rutidosis leptorrhynchoides]|uniref:F-box/kelch-repeat protein At3g06240-like n=1 Tax=Rutidosis leptorrhynchoides TaxID=125765 RepID=UPI003A99C3BA
MSALNRYPPELIEAILPFLPPKSLGRFKTMEQWVGILGSCNGLLLVIDKHHNLYLANPTTRKTLKVLAGISNDETYRFGYDSSTDDYKVISISHMGISDSDLDTKSVRVYRLRNNSWNLLPNFSYKCDLYCPGELLLNNNLHWVVRSRRLTMTIATFSLASEQIHEIDFPDSINYIQGFRVTCSQLCSIDGKVVPVFCVGLSVPEYVYELWVMDEYGVPNSWTKLCILEIDIYPSLEFFVPVSNRDILFGNSDTEKVYIYNMDERRCTSVTVEGCPEGFMVIDTYVESLESPERFR